jgi:hypothetical protein
MDPFVERDAFVNQLNQQRIQNQVAFNSGGMTDPTAGMTPGLNYQQAMQQAGLGGGAPSMAANYGDNLIQRLNQSFGGQGDPFAFANQQGYYQPQGAPAMTQQAAPSLAGSGGYNPGWGIMQYPPAAGAPAMTQQPAAPQSAGLPASAYTLPRTGIDANRSQFLQNKAAGRYENPAATYDDYVKSGLDDAVGKVVNSSAGYELYNQYQAADPSQKKAYGDRLKNLIYASASQQNVAPADDWMSKKTGKSAAEGKDQYFNDAMGRYAAKQPAGKAQPIQPPSQGTPYAEGQKFKYDKDPTLGNAEFQKWLDVKAPARFALYDRAANEKMYDQFLAEKGQPPSQPQYGTPPDRRNGARTLDWRDADRDGVDDRDQDGPGMPAYGRPGKAQPIAPPSQGTPYQPPATSPAPPREPSASPPSNADRTEFDAENKKKMDRLGQLRNQQFAYVKNKKGGGYTPPPWDKEYQDLMKWAMSPATYTSVNEQQFRQIADWFPGTFGGNPNAIRR